MNGIMTKHLPPRQIAGWGATQPVYQIRIRSSTNPKSYDKIFFFKNPHETGAFRADFVYNKEENTMSVWK